VSGLPQQTDSGVRFELSDSRSRNARLPARIRLSWHGGPPVRSGERWRLAVTLKRPSGLLNFHGVDHEAWLLAQRIGAPARLKDGERLAPARNAWRDAVRQRLMAVDAQGREAGLAGPGAGGRLRADGRRLACLAGHRHGAFAGHFRPAHWPVGGVDLRARRRSGALRLLAAHLAVAAVGVWPGVYRGVGVRPAGGVRRAGAARLCMVGLVLLWRCVSVIWASGGAVAGVMVC